MPVPQPHLYLIDNTRPIDPTLPDPIDNLEVPPVAALAAIAGGFLGRASGWAFWVAVGVIGALVL